MKQAQALGLNVLASAAWPPPDGARTPAPIPGFIESTFSPLVAQVAEQCLESHYGRPPATDGQRTAVVIASVYGDVTTAVALASAVDRGARVAPLLFFQSVPNAVAGHISSRWGLSGPVVCTSPVQAPLADALAAAALLIDDGDADAALVVVAEQANDAISPQDSAVALLVAGPRADTQHEGV